MPKTEAKDAAPVAEVVTQTFDPQAVAKTIEGKAAELVLMGHYVPPPHSHRRGAADLVSMGLWDERGQTTPNGEAVKQAIRDSVAN